MGYNRIYSPRSRRAQCKTWYQICRAVQKEIVGSREGTLDGMKRVVKGVVQKKVKRAGQPMAKHG